MLEYLENSEITLENVNFQYELKNKELGGYIEDCFDSFLEETSIGSTGASKALHMFSPKVFMMWDNGIIAEYHKDGEENHWRKHSSGSGECYVTFLKETQKFIVKNLDMDELESDNPVKIMDEYNYAKYTLDEG